MEDSKRKLFINRNIIQGIGFLCLIVLRSVEQLKYRIVLFVGGTRCLKGYSSQ